VSAAIPKDTQTSLERVGCYLQGKKPARVACFPILANHAARVLGIPIGTYNRDGAAMARAHVAAFRRYGHDALFVFTTTSTLAEAMGTRMRFLEEDAPQIERPLLEDWSSLGKVHVPDPTRDGRLPVYLEATERLVAELGGETVVTTVLAAPFTTAAALRPIELFVKDLYREKAKVHEVLELSLQAALRFLDEIIERKSLPVVVEPIGSGALVSPRTFEEFVTPYLRRMSDHIHSYELPAVLHICGNSRPSWAGMAASGFDLWSLDARIDLAEAVEKFGRSACLIGNVSTTTLLKGSREDVDREARAACEKALANPGGFVLGSGCEIPLETPPENLDALIDAARRYGRHDA
jgi:uroporphyrinogen decarboxylase